VLEEGQEAAGEECLVVANDLTATLQLRGMAGDIRRRIITGKGEVGRPRQCSPERKKATVLDRFRRGGAVTSARRQPIGVGRGPGGFR
jgi:hypothetical protein